MTEHYDEYEDTELRDELDEFEAELDELDEINAEIGALSQAYGVDLNSSQIQELGELIDAGYDPAGSFEALGLHRDVAFDNQFGANVERLEAEKGRSLTEAETDRLWQGATERGDASYVPDGAVNDLSSRQGRIGHMSERFQEVNQPQQQEQAESVTKPPAGSSKADRLAYMTQRMAGAEAADTDTYEGDE